ncbi:hypothetical protein [Bacteriovorax sp. Seq25_V]|uniref:hypothetical protein n=1 Tax=Bacteriovorax sp. Seq25_V TaxID=1201288 RepID=UPI00038A4F2A|nr:hypothetical protein [Bacteriovorax sp. Seq25_V]EQC44237.1 hypothetical protein M900_A0474 [Bacteriovorax sp. Seq25_V]
MTILGPQKTFNWIRGRDIIGRPIENISFNDMITKYSYDKNNQLLELENLDHQDKIISTFDYSYNEIGNITSLTQTLNLGKQG